MKDDSIVSGNSFSATSENDEIKIGGPFRLREELIDEIKLDFMKNIDEKERSSQVSHFVNNLDNSMFLIGDPFNRSYNPAKIQAHSYEADTYDRAFKAVFLQMKKLVSSTDQGIDQF